MTETTRPSFGISTPPQQVAYADLQRVWLEADTVPEIEHAWAFDHLLPIASDKNGPILEGWTLLSALAAQTTRLRVGLLVTSNRIRPPALLAKIAATVDQVSGGRLEFGIGAGSRTDIPGTSAEYEAYGLPFHDAAYATGSLAEACTVIKRLWTEDEPFDFHGQYVDLTGAFCNPKPVQRPGPRFVMGGRGPKTLKVVAEHADVWNMQGGLEDGISRGAVLDRYCTEIGRDPASILRSVNVTVSYDKPGTTTDAIGRALEAGVQHFVLSLRSPYPAGVVQWVAEELIKPSF
jgi:alkanesulfonate monooxygenase SsuD/methylene tetrahydromethanopterin reductase-like flavin-dependent oxidoreductase (luciferase family)